MKINVMQFAIVLWTRFFGCKSRIKTLLPIVMFDTKSWKMNKSFFRPLKCKFLFKNSYSIALLAVISLCSCAPRREFVQFDNAGTFHSGPGRGDLRSSRPQGEYDSYELTDHGVPNQGIPPMYQGYQQNYQQNTYQNYQQGGYRQGYQRRSRASSRYDNTYPAVVRTYDEYGNPRNVIIPNPW